MNGLDQLDDLDDLGSFDSAGSPSRLKRTAAAGSPRGPYYNPLGLTIGNLSPSSRSLNSDMSSTLSKNHLAHSVNAVHMHVQENAKIPLLNQAVDRTNSSSRPSYGSNLGGDLWNIADGPSMAELFLSKESKHRQSLNQNYESLGALLEDIGVEEKRRVPGDKSSKLTRNGAANKSDATFPDDAQLMEIDALTAAIDPTPWSEIEEKMTHKQQHHQQLGNQADVPQPPVSQNATIGAHPHHYSYYPYGRHHQLPIPERSSPPRSPSATTATTNVASASSGGMAQALATAAAIAATTAAQKVSVPSSTPNPLNQHRGAMHNAYTKAQQKEAMTTKSGTAPRHYQRHRATYSPPKHASAHTTSTASMVTAASKKSQYGFGGDHTVPSVPAPPPFPSSDKKKGTGHMLPPIQLPDLQHYDSRGQTTSPNNSGAAYERKKQRAKDARVKLNESIERLSIAMSVAGAQSKQRHRALIANRVRSTPSRQTTLQLSNECVKITEDAKKWDRPSFVGSAASLVQSLNAQCESLMRELVALHDTSPASPTSTAAKGTSLTTHPDHKRHDHPSASLNENHSNGHSEHNAKRMRGGETNLDAPRKEAIQKIVDVPADEKVIYGAVATMLDPISLTRCRCVSKRWRDMGIFDANDVWLALATRRFGYFNVRQWGERQAENEEWHAISNVDLYREMDAANVMPHFGQDGLNLLGQARIPGRVSGWAFIVERSNGETLRSVKRETEKGLESGTYQSRHVVELLIVVQNTGAVGHDVLITNQQISVDISTRRSGGQLNEIGWDDRLTKVVKGIDGNQFSRFYGSRGTQEELCRLGLFESAVLDVHIDARGCSTISRFQQRSNFTKVLVCLDGTTTVPMVIPFVSDRGVSAVR